MLHIRSHCPRAPDSSSSSTKYDTFALVLAAAITLLVAIGLRRRFGPWIIVLSAFLPVPIVALFAKQFDFAGWHAFMHASPIYQIMDRGVLRPEEPLFAGAAIRYPWVEQWITAQASRFTGVNPLVLSLVAQTFAYAVFLAGAAWLAATVTRDRVTIALATLLSAFGITIFHFGFLAGPAQRAFPPLWLDPRAVPLDKFLNITAAPLGLAAMLRRSAACPLSTGSSLRMILIIPRARSSPPSSPRQLARILVTKALRCDALGHGGRDSARGAARSPSRRRAFWLFRISVWRSESPRLDGSPFPEL